uniref:Uncharacterized protein n=1 Tax=Anguilla anguilla TaxID=7936 RepID=A0A0E9PA85_ANGAN
MHEAGRGIKGELGKLEYLNGFFVVQKDSPATSPGT